ncbi:hypothetical protein JCM9279_004063 [Rhodotorula babjevae]
MSKPLSPAVPPPELAAPPSPPSLDGLTLTEARPAASWTRLPVELKKRIVHDVLGIIEEQEVPQGDDSSVPVTVGYFARKEISDKENMMSYAFKVHQLKRLEAINRELRDICSPISWKVLPFGFFDKAALERLEKVLPPHAAHVRLVGFGGVAMQPCCGSPIKNSDALARDKVASRLFRTCANVEEVAITEPRQQPDGVFKLEHLRVASVATSSYRARDFAFLQAQPHLEALFIHSKAPPLGSDSVQLAQSLSRFSHLKHLRVKGTKLVTNAFLERAVAIPSPLEGIEFVSAEADISFEALAAFLTNFSSTLVSVDLNLGDVNSPDLWDVDDGPSLELPRLETLGVGTDFADDFFLRLLSPDMPLSFFRLDFCPSIAQDPIHLVAFLQAHAASLKRVYLSSEALEGTDHWGEHQPGAVLPNYVVDIIVDECAELGIECTLGVERSDGGSDGDSVGDSCDSDDLEYLYSDGSGDEEDGVYEHHGFEIRVWTEPRTGSTPLEQFVQQLVRSGRLAFDNEEHGEGGEGSSGEGQPELD